MTANRGSEDAISCAFMWNLIVDDEIRDVIHSVLIELFCHQRLKNGSKTELNIPEQCTAISESDLALTIEHQEERIQYLEEIITDLQSKLSPPALRTTTISPKKVICTANNNNSHAFEDQRESNEVYAKVKKKAMVRELSRYVLSTLFKRPAAKAATSNNSTESCTSDSPTCKPGVDPESQSFRATDESSTTHTSVQQQLKPSVDARENHITISPTITHSECKECSLSCSNTALSNSNPVILKSLDRDSTNSTVLHSPSINGDSRAVSDSLTSEIRVMRRKSTKRLVYCAPSTDESNVSSSNTSDYKVVVRPLYAFSDFD